MTLDTRSTAYLVLLASCVMLAPVSTDMYLASMPDLAVVFETDPAAVQRTLGIFVLGFALGNLLHGPLGDRYGRRPVILGGLAVFIAASVACLLAPSIEALTVARFFQALGGCAPVVMARAAVRDVFPPQDAALTMSKLGSINGLAPIAAPILGGVLHAAYGWTASFYAMGLFGLMVASGVALFFRETLDRAHRQEIRLGSIIANYATLLRHPVFMGYALLSAWAFAGIFAFLAASSFVFQDDFGLSADAYGFVFGAITAGFLAGNIVSIRLTPRLGSPVVLRAGVAAAVIAGVSMAGLALVGVASPWAVALPQCLYALGMGLTMPQAFAGAIVPFPQMAGTASSLLGFIKLSLSVIVGAIMGLFIFPEIPAQTPMAVTIGITSVLSLMAYRMLRRSETPDPAAEPAAPVPVDDHSPR